MSIAEWGPLAAAVAAVLVAIGGLVQKRRQPDLDDAQIKSTIKKMSDETNLARDQRIWALEQYVDQVRPWTRTIRDIIDDLCHRLKAELEKTGGAMPEVSVPDPPEVPPPISLNPKG